MRCFRLACWFLLLVGSAAIAVGSPSSRPLDLPSGGKGKAEEEEDAPETIQFFGAFYEGDGFFFLLDKSGSMVGLKMTLLKAEVSSALSELSDESDFGIVAFSGDVQAYSPLPVAATGSEVSSAHAWVELLVPYGPTQMLGGAAELLSIAALSPHANRSVIVVGDGLPNGPGPEETLAGIVQLNIEGLPFHTLLLGNQENAVQFMSDLAEATGGTFRIIPL